MYPQNIEGEEGDIPLQNGSLIQYSISSGSMSSWTLINSLDYFLIWRKSKKAHAKFVQICA
jgi:hypothetical protein